VKELLFKDVLKYFKIGEELYGCEHAYDGGRTRKGRVV